MSLAAAAGFPNLSGTFLPEIWSSKLLVKFYAATVYGAIANTDYEGEITEFGDKVQIRTTPTIIVRNYKKGQNLVHERPESPNVILNIDHGKYWDFVADDIDRKQSDINFVEDWAEDASEQLKIEIDKDINANIFPKADPANKGLTAGKISGSYNLGATGAPVVLTKSNIIDFITDMGSVLDEQNVPERGRYAVLPAWVVGMIKKSDLKDASISGDAVSVARNGRVGMIDRMTIYLSNLLSTAVDGGSLAYNMFFGQKHALTFASQLVENDLIKAESTFGQIYRGLQVYGYEVLKPDALGHFYAIKG